MGSCMQGLHERAWPTLFCQSAVLFSIAVRRLTKTLTDKIGMHARAGLALASDAGAALKAGDAALARGETGAAVDLYSRAVEADPKGLLPLTKRAAAYGKLGEHRMALKDLEQALQLDGTSVQALLHR